MLYCHVILKTLEVFEDKWQNTPREFSALKHLRNNLFANILMTVCSLDSTCVPKCPEGFFTDMEDGRVCARCHFSCKSCIGRHSRECSACKPGFYKQGKSCVELCSDRWGQTALPSPRSLSFSLFFYFYISLSLSVTLVSCNELLKLLM